MEVDTLRLLAQPKEGQQQFKNKKQPELAENQTTRKSNNQGDKEKTFIETGRRGGDGQPGRRELWQYGGWQTDSERWQIVEQMGQAVQQLADPAAPHWCIDKLGGTAGEQNRLCNPGLQRWGNKASNL